jgi:hypothetical protein
MSACSRGSRRKSPAQISTPSRFFYNQIHDIMLVRTLSQFELDLIDVAPTPVRSVLGGFHDGVAGRMEVLCCVLVLGGITATDMATGQTEPEFDPLVPARNTFFTAIRLR